VTQNFIGVCAIKSVIGTVARSISRVTTPAVRATAVLATASSLLIASPAQATFFTPGQFDVTPSGAASYTVPIAVPPGTAGMAPSLALSYNSQGGNGLLGMGWSLSGLSAITRCPKTLIQDGVKSAVNYTASDSLCLDGQRLVAIAGSYGSSGTEYRTEGESFSRIISYGTSGSPVTGPGYFKVWTKSGQIMEFGNTVDSAVETQGPAATAASRPIRVWAVNKITDSKGNYLAVKYAKDTVTWGAYVPTSILYTGNARAGLLPYSHVDFHLLARTDTQIGYDGGSRIGTPWLIDHIYTYTVVKGVDTLVKDYRLAYDVSTATKRSRVTQLQECDGLAVTATCLKPTKLGWQQGGTGFAPETEWANGNNWAGQGWFGFNDFNGDGKPDLWFVNPSSSRVMVRLSTGAGFAPETEWANGNNWAGQGWFGFNDFNGDGKPDLWFVNPLSSRVMVRSASPHFPDLLLTITNGLGASTAIAYKPLTDATVYTKESTATYPLVDIQAPLYVVSSVSSSNGVGGDYVSNYRYTGAKSHLTGGGFLGFRQTVNTDPQTGIVSTTTYRQDYPFQGLPLTAQKQTATGVVLNNVSNTWASTVNAAWSAQYHAPQLTQSVETSYELTGGLISTVTTGTTYDAYGNPTVITVSTPDGYSKTTTNTYVNDTGNWYLGRLTNATVSSTKP